MVTIIGPLATISCEPRQARKGAAAAVNLCAGVWLVVVTTSQHLLRLIYLRKTIQIGSSLFIEKYQKHPLHKVPIILSNKLTNDTK